MALVNIWNVLYTYPTGDLVLTEPGETCEKRGLTPISSHLDCKASKAFIQKDHKNYHFNEKEINNATFPKGCFIRLFFDVGVDDQGYFNIHSSGAVHKQARTLCKNTKSKLSKDSRL